MSLFATTVPTMTGLAATPRPVIDQTGLSGLYDFTLNWIHDPSGEDAISDNIAAFHEALKAQLGVVLKSSHAPMPFLIVDRVERPSENSETVELPAKRGHRKTSTELSENVTFRAVRQGIAFS